MGLWLPWWDMSPIKYRYRRADSELMRLKQTVIDQNLAKIINATQAAGLLNIHPKAYLRLKARYKILGISALFPKKPGPKVGNHNAYNRTPKELEEKVILLSIANPYSGPLALSRKLLEIHGIRLHQTTVWRILSRNTARYSKNLNRKRTPPILYCLEEPGIEVQIDACFPFGRSRDVIVFDAVDDSSRFLGAEVYDGGETYESMTDFIRQLVKSSPFRIKSLRLDNRFNYLRFRKFCAYYRITTIFNEPYHPEQNGKIERYHRTFKNEVVYRKMSFSDPLEVLRYKLKLWVMEYNFHRPHGGYGMNGLTPVQKLGVVNLAKIVYPQKVTLSLQPYIKTPACSG